MVCRYEDGMLGMKDADSHSLTFADERLSLCEASFPRRHMMEARM
jgi:hypothetical protein